MTPAPIKPSPSPLGEFLRAKRDGAGLTQIELAERTGFTQAAISAWELGVKVPSARAVAALAEHLPDVTVGEVLGFITQADR